MAHQRQQKRSLDSFYKWTSFYLGLACFVTFVVSMYCERWAFDNLEQLQRLSGERSLTMVEAHSWLHYSAYQIVVPEFSVRITKVSSVDFAWMLVLSTALSCLIGALAYAFRGRRRLLVIPNVLYVLVAFIYFESGHPTALGTVMTAGCYSMLFFAAIAIREFDAHWEALECGVLDNERFASLSKLLNQYTLTSVGAVAFITVACLFNTAALGRDVLGGQNQAISVARVYRAIDIPWVISVVAYGVFGSFWLGALITRELHIKQHELLLMQLSTRVPEPHAIEKYVKWRLRVSD